MKKISCDKYMRHKTRNLTTFIRKMLYSLMETENAEYILLLTNSSVHCISSAILVQGLTVSNVSKFATLISLLTANANIKMISHMKVTIS